MPDKPYYIDSNVVIEYSKEIFEKYSNINLSGYVLGELDNLKKNGKTEEVKFQARRATRDINNNRDKITYIIDETDYNNLPTCFNKENMDNKIISLLKVLYDKDNNFVCLSNDMLFQEKCRVINIPCEKFEPTEFDGEKYTGYKILEMSEYELANWYESETKANLWNLNINEYQLANSYSDISNIL